MREQHGTARNGTAAPARLAGAAGTHEATSDEILGFAGVGVAYIGPEDGIIVSCNPAYAALLGYTPEELAGHSFFDFVDKEQEAKARRERELRLEGTASEYEIAVKADDDGSERRLLLLATGVPLPLGEDGSYRGAVQTLVDVTEKRRAEESLRKSEERFRLVARTTNEVIWDNDLHSDSQEWDGAVEEAFGYPPERIEGATAWWEGRVHPDDRARVLSGLGAVLRPGGGEAWADEYRFLRADGSYATVTDRGYVVRDEATGEPVRVVGSMRDVTDRRRGEEALRRSERRHRFVFEEAPVGMALLAPDDGRWLAVNPKLCEVLGYGRDRLLAGMAWQDVTHPDDLEADLELAGRVLRGEMGSYSVEKRYVRGDDGRVVWAKVTVSLRRGASGEAEFFASMVEDVTERKLKDLVPDPLTERELEVMRGICAGKTNERVARDIPTSEGTVKREARHILAKLKKANVTIDTREQAAAWSVEIGLIPPPSQESRLRGARRIRI